MADDLRFSLLGPVRAWRDDKELKLGSPQQRMVLAVLLLAEGRAAGPEQLIDAVWGEEQPRTALSTLRTYISRLRGVLGAEVLSSVGHGYVLLGGERDVAEFERLYGERRYTEALALWQGEPLAGLDGFVAEAQRARLKERRLAALECRLDADLNSGKYADIVPELTALCADHPTNERMRGLLMLALYLAGRQAEAIGVYTDTRELLDRELGVSPSPELAELYQRIISADAALGRPAERVTPRQVPRQLPSDVADFTGREREVEGMVAALRSGEASALVVSAVSGAGGVGKTTLAVHAAHRLAGHYPDGQLFVDLRGSSARPVEPGVALGAFLRALGQEEPPEDLAERAAEYRTALADRRVLVVLDNASDAGQVRPLMPGSAQCGVIVTSRARLTGLSGARQVDLEVLGPAEALLMFARIVGEERVSAERGAAMDLVAACGFLPLAIRIAAARLAARPSWSLATMRDRLSDERRRMAELRVGDLAVEATFSLGYDQLDAAHARAFRLLAVSDAAMISLPVAAALLDLPETDAEEVCEALVNLSMLESPSPGRYRFHDLLKIYARSRPDDSGVRQAALARMLDFCLATVAGALRLTFLGDLRPDKVVTRSGGLRFADESAAVDWADEEEQGLLSCLEQTARTPGGELRQAIILLDMTIDVIGYESDTARYERLCDLLVAAAADRSDGVLEAQARCVRGFTWVSRRRLDAATEDGLAARDLSLEHGDLDTYADSLNLLARSAMSRRETAESASWYEQAAEVFRSLGDLANLAITLGNLARVLADLGRMGEALDAAREAEKIMLEVGDGRPDAGASYQLGIVLRQAGYPEQSLAELEKALAEHRMLKKLGWEGATLFRMAETYLLVGSSERAVEHAEDALAVLTKADDEWAQGMALTVLGRALGELGQPGRARACLTEALTIFDRLDVPEAEDVRLLLVP
ncbi:AfsR/SARP family transcriptional regulator [Nonomuraea endophytica]|uniref:DNA-binding SARP family transcriptional activator n=1 Tax=Nonomuraea endophytica TaxID=714136 RepID=A0A7W7ZWW9_9ACTN|nr:BTAD domain-containing putative transcriptional regulator [Nonomuraea endophytica]MBB5075300.1 DNA-binding SARP family transcriptional activator [Nonomuraea endophytica]